MLLITCPWCGARDQTEFSYHGEAHIVRPENPAALDDAAWGDYVFFRANPRGPHRERWMHAAGCRRFFIMARDTLSGEIFGVYKPGEKPPPTPAREGGERMEKSRSRENRAAKFGGDQISRRARAHNPPAAAPVATGEKKPAPSKSIAAKTPPPISASGGEVVAPADAGDSSAPLAGDEKTGVGAAAANGGNGGQSASDGVSSDAAVPDGAARLGDDEMLRLLDSVGKGCFVRFFALFARAAKGDVGNKEAAEELQAATGDAFATCKSRVSKAKKIFTAAAADRALAAIAGSQKTPSSDRALAREILAGLAK